MNFLKFNLSFSVNGTAHTEGKETADSVFDFFLESIGATITEFKDVKFRFNIFDLNNAIRTWNELYNEIFEHYKIQSLQQVYVLILGLDVLGNPFGLVSDFSQNLQDLFYDPLLGYLSKSNQVKEFHMRKKVKATVDKTISSVAGSGSLITGSVGRVLATCTFDKEYKMKRQYKLSKLTTTNIPDTLIIAGKGVVSGLIYGVTGVFKKPIEEKKQGVKGVMSGVGKGLAGLFAKPIGSVFDSISITLDGLKRFAQSGSESIVNTRLPRHLINELAILPYSEYQAKGYEILRDLQNDNIALGEKYWAHIFIGPKLNAMIFITDCNIYKLKKTRTQIFAKWFLVDKPIPLHKIKQIKLISPDPVSFSNIGKKSEIRRQNRQQVITQQFYISYTDRDTVENLRNDEKILLLTSNSEVISWLNDKITSVIKYYKELKTFAEIF